MTGLIVVVLRAVARQIEEGIRYLQKNITLMSGCWVVSIAAERRRRLAWACLREKEIKHFFITEGVVYCTSFSETRRDELPIIKLPDDGKKRVQLVERCVVRRW